MPKLRGGKEGGSPESARKVPDAPLTDRLNGEALFGELGKAVRAYDKSSERYKSRIVELLSGLSAAERNNLVYKMFAPHYDKHMDSHGRAIDFLIRQAAALEAAGLGGIFHDDIIELSCGTGSVIKSVCDALPAARLRDLVITANDLSDDMKAIAMEKLVYLPCEISYTSQDLMRLMFAKGSFGTAVLSQTLHLLTDEDILMQERAGNYMHIDEKRHLSAKIKAVRDAFSLVRPGGTFIVIDEYPALLSDRGGPLGPGFAYLFNDSLRGVNWATFRNSIMNPIPNARFVAQLKVPIDYKHTMYIWIYRNEPEREGRERRLPNTHHFDAARREAREKLLSLFRAIDRDFIASNSPPNGETPWVRYLPMDPEKTLVVTEGRMDFMTRYNMIVLSGCMHNLSEQERHTLIGDSVHSLDRGGSLLIVDEWRSPRGSRHPISKGHLRDEYMAMHSKHMVFAGSIRVPIIPPANTGMYGYLYRKVF